MSGSLWARIKSFLRETVGVTSDCKAVLKNHYDAQHFEFETGTVTNLKGELGTYFRVTNLKDVLNATAERHLAAGNLEYDPMYNPGDYHAQLLFDQGGGSCKLVLKHLHHKVANSTRNVTLLGMFTGIKDDQEGLQLAFGPLWAQMDALNAEGKLTLTRKMPLKAMEQPQGDAYPDHSAVNNHAGVWKRIAQFWESAWAPSSKSEEWESKAKNRPEGYKRAPRKNRSSNNRTRRPGWRSKKKNAKILIEKEFLEDVGVDPSGAHITMAGGTQKDWWKESKRRVDVAADARRMLYDTAQAEQKVARANKQDAENKMEEEDQQRRTGVECQANPCWCLCDAWLM